MSLQRGFTIFTWIKPRIARGRFLHLCGKKNLQIGLTPNFELQIIIDDRTMDLELRLDPSSYNFLSLSFIFRGSI